MKEVYERSYRVVRANVSMYRDNRDWYVRQDKLFPITGSHLKHAKELYQLNQRAFENAMRSFREGHTIIEEQPIIDLIIAVLKHD